MPQHLFIINKSFLQLPLQPALPRQRIIETGIKPITTTPPIKASNPNIPRQFVTKSNSPPNTGAQIGAKPCTQANMEKNFAKSFPPYKSVAIDLEITIPPAPESPWIKRAKIKISMPGEKTQATDEKTKKNIEITSGRFGPNLSLTGPKNICPTASPTNAKCQTQLHLRSRRVKISYQIGECRVNKSPSRKAPRPKPYRRR